MANSTKILIVLCLLLLVIFSGSLAAQEQRYIVKFKPGVDENKQHASFSLRTNQVELAAPGVHVLSSVPMGTGLATTT
ncbi:hypothetical protein EKG38_12760 [Shewanella canadensis]|uniref:Uncharacterized protein n=1 Tax=Shewanella canadensis TaxID=271096 RepID=A0A3S0INM7_9GAMM|nr:hypothetical protein [Shewanella canadensis]RTR38388.1 hypothetical protein EKG38_12760 [Shewanella canadensis]